jgi:hypothetical protein
LAPQPTNIAAKRRVDEAAKKVEELANALRDALKSRDPVAPNSDSLVRGPAEAAKKASRNVAEAALHNPKDLGEKSHELKVRLFGRRKNEGKGSGRESEPGGRFEIIVGEEEVPGGRGPDQDSK